MQLGSFLGKLKGEGESEPKQFLALVLTDDIVQAAVWHVVHDQTEIIAKGTPVEWDGDSSTTNEFITASDAAISLATEGISQEVGQVILGIPHSWTTDKGILGAKQILIQKLSHELDLTPIGFVVISDSVISYLKIQEGTPTSSILVQVSADELLFVLVRLGRIEGVEVLGRSDDIVEDVTEALSRFNSTDNFPSRIILFDGMHDLEDLVQNLLSVDWQKSFHFLHTPKVEALNRDIAISALVVAGGSEIARSLGFDVQPIKPTPKEPTSIEPTPKAPTEPLLTAQEIGFGPAPIEPKSTPPRIIPKLKLPHLSLPHLKLKKLYLVGISGLLLLAILLFYFLYALPHATLTIYIIPKSLEQEVSLTLTSTESSIDFDKRIVPAQIEIIKTQGEKSLETSGTKLVGETASGTVTLYNRTSAAKSFPAGTLLSAGGGLKFSLDTATQIASGSADNDYVGKAQSTVSATAIGSASNLKEGTEFTIQAFAKDSFVAKAQGDLTGGSSQEARVVSQEDQSSLTKSLSDDLLQKLSAQVSQDTPPGAGSYLLASSAKIEEANYSAKVGEATDTLKADLTLAATLLRYQTADVTTLINQTIDSKVPEGFIRANAPATVALSADTVSKNGDSVQGQAKVSVALMPVTDPAKLAELLKGQNKTAAQTLLTSQVPGLSSIQIDTRPSWLGRLRRTLPLAPQNIQVRTQIVPL